MMSLRGKNILQSLAFLCQLFFGLQLLLCHVVNAQSLTIRGQVDANHLSLPNVRVLVSRAGKETTTDKEGKFTLVVFSQDTLTMIHPNFPTRQYVLPALSDDISLYFDMANNSGFWVNSTKTMKGTISSTSPLSTEWLQKAIPSFPWPVPPSSAKVVLDTQFFRKDSTLAQVDRRMKNALLKSGYPDPSYYQIPQGFAMVGRIEQIESDGTPKQTPARWSVRVEPFGKFSLSNYLMLLFTSATGHFRIIVFLVTDVDAVKDSIPVPFDEAMAWYRNGVDFLPPSIGKLRFTENYRVTAHIYEFEKPETAKARLLDQSAFLGQDHLSKSKIMANLTR